MARVGLGADFATEAAVPNRASVGHKASAPGGALSGRIAPPTNKGSVGEGVESPQEKGGERPRAPTKHGQREQEVLPQLVAHAQAQVSVLWLLGAEVAVVHAHFHLLGHVVGTATETKRVISDSLGWGKRRLLWAKRGTKRE